MTANVATILMMGGLVCRLGTMVGVPGSLSLLSAIALYYFYGTQTKYSDDPRRQDDEWLGLTRESLDTVLPRSSNKVHVAHIRAEVDEYVAIFHRVMSGNPEKSAGLVGKLVFQRNKISKMILDLKQSTRSPRGLGAVRNLYGRFIRESRVMLETVKNRSKFYDRSRFNESVLSTVQAYEALSRHYDLNKSPHIGAID